MVAAGDHGAWRRAVESLDTETVLVASLQATPGPELLERMLAAGAADPGAVIDARVVPVETRRLDQAADPVQEVSGQGAPTKRSLRCRVCSIPFPP